MAIFILYPFLVIVIKSQLLYASWIARETKRMTVPLNPRGTVTFDCHSSIFYSPPPPIFLGKAVPFILPLTVLQLSRK
jgi:hypothetical protein